MEEEYTGNYAHVLMNGKEQAKRMISKALSKGDSLERACVLSNMIRTCEPEMQITLLAELVERDSTALLDPAMSLTGITEVVENFKKKESVNIKAAETAMEKVKNAMISNETLVQRVRGGNSDPEDMRALYENNLLLIRKFIKPYAVYECEAKCGSTVRIPTHTRAKISHCRKAAEQIR